MHRRSSSFCLLLVGCDVGRPGLVRDQFGAGPSVGLELPVEERANDGAALIPEPAEVPAMSESASGRSRARIAGCSHIHQRRSDGARIEALVARVAQRCGSVTGRLRGWDLSDPVR